MFIEKYNNFIAEFGKGKTMVLSTSVDNIVSSRMMSVVLIDDLFYFQTDVGFKKYKQLIANPNVALCIDNIQIEGVAEELGLPIENTLFCERFKECYKGSYDAYTALKNERLFAVRPVYIERWIYKEKVPYIETFDFIEKEYQIRRYEGK